VIFADQERKTAGASAEVQDDLPSPTEINNLRARHRRTGMLTNNL
jgi:hypothetical protein